MVIQITFPKTDWKTTSPAEAGINPEKLEKVRAWLDQKVDKQKYRFAIIRHGRLAVEWYSNIQPDAKLGIASAAKSIYSNVLGIVVDEGKIPSADAKVVDYYPEMMDVPKGKGPKPGRYAFPENKDITFRQLICNTSGYMKPGEAPGKVYNYQTFGMNALTHSLAKVYGLYDVKNPQGSPGFKVLIKEKLADPIGAQWEYNLGNFSSVPQHAHMGIFGYYCGVKTTLRDLARLGWLWFNWGKWENKQVIPEKWFRESTKVAPDIKANCPKKEWCYGHGIWTNEFDQMWPGLPHDGYTASGAGGHYVTLFPGKEIVIIQNPGHYSKDGGRANPELLKLVLDALE